jgi:hypothetical protein
MFPFIPQGQEITVDGMAILFGAHQDDDDCPEFAGCSCPEPRGRATRRIEIRHCEDEDSDADMVLCHASEEWPDLYRGVFGTRIELGGKRRHAEIDIRFGNGREIGPVFLLCRYRTDECAGAHREMFSDPISWTNLSSRLNRPPSLRGASEDEQRLAIADYPLRDRRIPQLQ